MIIEKESVIQFARHWEATPFRWGGRDRSGLDCVGLALVFYSQMGLLKFWPDPLRGIEAECYYKCPKYRDPLLGILARHFSKAPKFETGDLLIFKGERCEHCGICIDSNCFVHVSAPTEIRTGQVRIEHFNRHWTRNLVNVFRPVVET